MENKIRKLLKEGKPTVNTRIWSTWPTTAEAAAVCGKFDYLVRSVHPACTGEFCPSL